MARQQAPGYIELARRAGCWANALVAIGIFFLIGALVSLFNGEIGMTLQALIAASLMIAVAILVGRKVGRERPRIGR